MPELPDVEGAARLLRRHLVGRPLSEVRFTDRAVVRGTDPEHLAVVLTGARLDRVTRHGKWLSLSGSLAGTVLVHLGMTGRLARVPPGPGRAPERFECWSLGTTDSAVCFLDRRRLGSLSFATGASDVEQVTGPLGPDAARITRDRLAAVLGGTRRPLKTVLVDQSAIAGLGSMLSDELLWRAREHPLRPANALSRTEVDRLHSALRDIVRRSSRAGHIPRTRGWLASQRALEAPYCPRCGEGLIRVPVGGRRALACPICQPSSAPRGDGLPR